MREYFYECIKDSSKKWCVCHQRVFIHQTKRLSLEVIFTHYRPAKKVFRNVLHSNLHGASEGHNTIQWYDDILIVITQAERSNIFLSLTVVYKNTIVLSLKLFTLIKLIGILILYVEEMTLPSFFVCQDIFDHTPRSCDCKRLISSLNDLQK